MMLLLNKFTDDCKTRGIDAHTIETYNSNIRLFFDHVQIKPDEISINHLTEFLSYLRYDKIIGIGIRKKIGASNSTINGYYSALQAFYDYLEFYDLFDHNPIPKFRRRYLVNINKKSKGPDNTRQLINIHQMAQLVYTTTDPLERALIITLAKTGVRKNELMTMDLSGYNPTNGTIYIKSTPKRSLRIVYIDQEAIDTIDQYLESKINNTNPALFIINNHRVNKNDVHDIVTENAKRLGFHNPDGLLIEKFTAHCCRHWFTAHLRRAGMSEEYRMALRGDVVTNAVGIYDHIDLDFDLGDVRAAYLKMIPQLSEALVCPAADLWISDPGRQTLIESF